jgi:N utilization substance protein B
MTRQESRRAAFRLLFEYTFGGDPEEIMANAKEYRGETISGFARQLFTGTLANLQEIDSKISAFAEKRSLERIARVPLSCLRLASYELLYTETPAGIAVNEALDICREYNCDDSVSFVNGVLGKVSEAANKE